MAVWPYNTSAWKSLRLHILHRDPMCVYCKELGILTPATEVDHIIPVRDDEARAFDSDNLQGLCKTCHDSVKAKEEERGYRLGCGPDGIPHFWA